MVNKEKVFLKYSDMLVKKNLKVTPQRVEILKIIEYADHIDIDGIYNEILKAFPYVSLATIYKNLSLMAQKQIINEIKAPNQKLKYEITSRVHAHFICSKCAKIEDIEVDENCVKNCLQDKTLTINNISIQVYGICNECL